MRKLILYILLLTCVYISPSNTAWLKKTDKQEKAVSVIGISAQKTDNGIKVSFTGIANQDVKYNIYRSSTVIDSADKLKQAELIKSLKANETSYLDGIAEGEHYYAVTTTDKNNKENQTLNSGQNYTTSAIVLSTAKSTESAVKTGNDPASFISTYQEEANIVVEWEDAQADSYNVYRNTKVIKDETILKQSKLLNNVLKGVGKFTDIQIPSDGEYYYAVIGLKNNKENIILIPDSNYTSIPVIYTKPVIETPPVVKEEPKPVEQPAPEKVEEKVEPVKMEEPPPPPKPKKKVTPKKKPKKRIRKKRRINYTSWLNRSIKKYYLTHKYTKASKELKKITKSRAPRKIKLKAQLFLGRIHYKNKKYRKALKYFINAKDAYPEEADFWIKNTLKKIK